MFMGSLNFLKVSNNMYIIKCILYCHLVLYTLGRFVQKLRYILFYTCICLKPTFYKNKVLYVIIKRFRCVYFRLHGSLYLML